MPVLVKWMNWVKQAAPINVKRIMIDCSATEIEAIDQVFGGSVSTLLCHWHIRRAWEKHLRTDVSYKNYYKE